MVNEVIILLIYIIIKQDSFGNLIDTMPELNHNMELTKLNQNKVKKNCYKKVQRKSLLK